MDQDLIVAFACESDEGEISFINLKTPVTIKDIFFKDNSLETKDIVMHYKWFKSITVCTKEVLAELRDNLQIA